MSQWSWKEGCWKETWIEPWEWNEKDNVSDDDEELFSKTDPERKEPWLTPTESCASDGTEEEEMKP